MMAGKYLIRMGLAGILAVMLFPAAVSAAQLTVNTAIPVRPQITFGPSLHMDTRSQSSYGFDQSEACRPEHRFKRIKRERRCRPDR